MKGNNHSDEQDVADQWAGDQGDDVDALRRAGCSDEEIISICYLRQWYRGGGSDRIEVIRHLEAAGQNQAISEEFGESLPYE